MNEFSKTDTLSHENGTPSLRMSGCCTLADCTHETNHEEQKIKNAKRGEFSWLMDVNSYIGLAHIHHGDCLKIMDLMIEDKTQVDMILCDLPYGKTKNVWDCEIPLSMLWNRYDKLLKPSGVVVLFGQDKFSAKLMLSKPEWHRYNLIWEKTSPTGHLNAKKMPLRSHEDILVFYRKLPTYNPQKTTGHERKVSTAKHKRNSKETTNYGKFGLTTYDSTERYPKSVLHFATDKQKCALHPTQKPVALLKYLIETYTNKGDTILDNCIGSGSTAVACVEATRFCIGIEKDETYYNIAANRINDMAYDETKTYWEQFHELGNY